MNLIFLYSLSALAQNAKLCLYGAGGGGIQFNEILAKLRPDINVVFFVDTYKVGNIEGVPILRHNLLKKRKGQYDGIVITSLFVDEIYRTIRSIDENCPVFYYTSLSTLAREPVSDSNHFCVIYANCQGKALLDMLYQSPSFVEQYAAVNFFNYTPQRPTPEILSRCNLFIYQHIPDVQVLLTALPANCQTICLPKISWRVFWPFNSNELRKYPYGDAFVLDLIRKGYSKEEIVRSYLDLDVDKYVNLRRVYRDNITYLNSPHNARDIQITDYIVLNFKSQELFCSVNHPVKPVLLRVANQILKHIGHQTLRAEDVAGLDPLGKDFQMPIHPSIAEFFKLEFLDSDATVNQFGERVDFQDYLINYVNSELAGAGRHEFKKGPDHDVQVSRFY